MNVARAGQQSGKESTASANVVPRAASRRRTLGILATSVRAWSSVITTRMLGRPSRSAVTGRAPAAAGSASVAISASAARAVFGALRGTSTILRPWIPGRAPNLHSVSHSVNRSGNVTAVATQTHRAVVRHSRKQSRERIVAAATELFRRKSYGELSVDEVMREAGFGRTIFYRHFDDLADLLMRAGREAIDDLYEAQRALAEARLGDGPEVVRRVIEAAVAVYQRHGPLLRAIAEAAGSDEQVAAGQEAVRARFDELLEAALREMPHLAAHPPADLAETARALNLLNTAYLVDAFGREPRVSGETAVQTLSEIWIALIHRPDNGRS